MEHIKNIIPTFHIISETKLCEDGIRSFFNSIDPRFFTNLDEKNKAKVSDSEKLVECVGNICNYLHSGKTNGNKEYIAIVNKYFSELCCHTSVTIAFNNVSQTFIDKLHRMHAKLEIHQRELGKEQLKFWLLPTYEDDEELAYRFAQLFESYGTLKSTLESDLSKKNKTTAKDNESIKRLLPNTYALDAVVTTNLQVWKDIIIKYTNLSYDDEIRYILLFLTKMFKQKYSNLFEDLVLVDKSDNIIGVDSLKVDGKIWRECKIVRK
jgi:thymidylate synthase ThyX